MADKLLIGISAQGATAALWRGKRISDCQAFTDDEDGQGRFSEYLESCRRMPAHIMVDAVEEDYRFETLPHTFGSDRRELVNRKLRQHYRNSPYMTAWRLGRDSGKRRDDRYLFSALTNPELVDGWLKAVVARGLPVAGVYLLPMVSAALLQMLDIRAANLLIVAQHPGGLRLTYFRDRQFRLSRLTRGDSAKGEDRVRHFSEEISNTRLYLHALRTMTLDEPLTVLVVDQTDELAEVTAGVARENPGLECTRLGRGDLAQRLGLPEALFDESPYAVYLQLLGAKAPTSNLAPATVTAGFKRHQARRAIYAASAAVALGAAIWTSVNLLQTLSLQGDRDIALRQTTQLSAQYAEITRQFPAAPASADHLRRTVEIAAQLGKEVRTPERMMVMMSRALETSPNIAIREFAWKYGSTDIAVEGGGLRTAADPSPAPVPPGAGAGTARRQSGLIEGEIRPFRGDYRAAIDTINAFADGLRRDPAVAAVRVVRLPLNVNPGLQLSGNTLDSPDQSSVAEFRLLIVFQPGL
jgi:hypothetical protein